MALTENAGWPIDNYVNAQARLTNGALFSIAFGAAVSGGEKLFYGHQRLTILGDKGILTAGSGPDALKVWVETEGVGHGREQLGRRDRAVDRLRGDLVGGADDPAPDGATGWHRVGVTVNG